ncbi:MAG: TIGR04282 family arsenosugar biosynthesis glycosyltransferase [Halioglobus sp.]
MQQFARAPEPGKVKTRMQPHLSEEEACDLHRELVSWCCARLLEADMGPVELWVAGDTADALFQRCVEQGVTEVYTQCGADLGDRMLQALRSGLQRADKVILVGSDCPAINVAYLAQAAAALDQSELVLGPAEDGGFVLIGATATDTRVFDGVQWGSAEVFAAVAGNLERLGIPWSTLPMLPDIDRPEDLPLWEAVRSLQI